MAKPSYCAMSLEPLTRCAYAVHAIGKHSYLGHAVFDQNRKVADLVIQPATQWVVAVCRKRRTRRAVAVDAALEAPAGR